MPFFSYVSVSPDGKKGKGILEALSREEAQRKLQTQGTIILSLKTAQHRKIGRELNANKLVEFIEQLSSYLKAGMPLYESLFEIAKQHSQERHYPILAGLCEQIKEGSSLADAMSQYVSFPEMVRATVAAGQSAGTLDETLEQLSIVLQNQQKIRKQFIAALLYPIILMGFSTLLVGVLLLYVVPSLELLFADRPINGITCMVIYASHFVKNTLPWLVPGLVIGSLFLKRFIKNPKRRLALEKFLFTIPIISHLLIQRELGRFAKLMGMMLQRGVPLIEALRIARHAFSMKTFETIFEKMEHAVLQGKLLSTELKHIPLIPPLFSQLLAIGDEGGNISGMFQKISTLYETEADRLLTRFTTLAQPILLLIMGVIVGLIMLAILLPLTDINAFI